MALHWEHVTVDAGDAAPLAAFWAEVLGWDVGPGASAEMAVHEKREWGAHWRALADPEGNEFCVVQRPAGRD